MFDFLVLILKVCKTKFLEIMSASEHTMQPF